MSGNIIDLNGKAILVTGAAGFIGAALCRRILKDYSDVRVIGIDNMNNYYDVSLKEYRLNELKAFSNFMFIKGDIVDRSFINSVFAGFRPEVVVNLAAEVGVRHSEIDPDAYIESNVIGFFRILEGCRHYPVEHLVYASSSSVYGNTDGSPSVETNGTDRPISLYGATKKSDELMAYAYGALYHIPSTGLRFFTVYGPAGRPDMAYFSFAEKMVKGEKIQIFNYGRSERDFTYIDDIVEGIIRVIKRPPAIISDKNGLSVRPCAVYNIGSGHPYGLMEFIDILEHELINAGVISDDYNFDEQKELLPAQSGDMTITYADMSGFKRDFGYCPSTSLHDGLREFANWYRSFYMNRKT